MKHFLPVLLCGAGLLCAASRSPAQIMTQTFSGYANGTTVASGQITNWSANSTSPAAGVVSNTAGYPSGNGLSLQDNGVDVNYTPTNAAPFFTQSQGTAEFTLNLRRTGDIFDSQILISSYGGPGFALTVEGSNVLLSTGGNSVYTATTRSVATTFSNNVWYTLDIKFALSSNPSMTMGVVNLYESSNPSAVLLNNESITSTGTSPYDSLNQVDFRLFGVPAGAAFQIDNLALAVVPEPGTASMALVFVAGVLMVSIKRLRRA